MTITFTLPLLEETPNTVKDMIFTILSAKYPLSLIELLNSIRKQYGVTTSFQSVHKAALQLVEAKVLVKDGKKFSINREWILEVIKFGNRLQKQYFTKPESREITKIEVGPNVTIYTIPTLVEMDTIWGNIMRDYFASIKTGPKIMVFEAVHYWWVLAQLATETALMENLKKQGIKSYFLCYGDNPLDKWAVSVYNDIGVHCKTRLKPVEFKNGHNIGVYGDLIIQATHPPEIIKKFDAFFKKYKNIAEAKLSELMVIATEKVNIKMTVIKDLLLANTIRKEILNKFKDKA